MNEIIVSISGYTRLVEIVPSLQTNQSQSVLVVRNETESDFQSVN